ncbi:hypothetical protein OEA41_005639 [Lepraria neglecta]|uniref:Uncharacterized protein n=1 Tax=Lepraria neglecta TaxID=209136 RepID=A0AAE0DMF9_9LECA|nr:hypothetical protein OEA41_005639 [Lepraria neglecta]
MSRGPVTDGQWAWFKPTNYPRARKTDDEAWPQWVGPCLVQNQAERDFQERLQREAEDISETTEYGGIKERKQLMMSPSGTPPLVRTRTMIVNPSRFPKSQASDTKIKKVRASKRPAPRRPVTRSLRQNPRLALHPCKGRVIFGLFSKVTSFETYLQDHDPEKQTLPAGTYLDGQGSPWDSGGG